jgi:hypothetical protein
MLPASAENPSETASTHAFTLHASALLVNCDVDSPPKPTGRQSRQSIRHSRLGHLDEIVRIDQPAMLMVGRAQKNAVVLEEALVEELHGRQQRR